MAGGRAGVLINVKISTSYDPTASKAGVWEATSILAWVQLMGQTAVTSQNRVSSTLHPS